MTAPVRPRIEVVFRRGKPVAVFFHLREGESGKTGRQIYLKNNMTAHYGLSGMPVGLEITLPSSLDLSVVNDALRDLGSAPVDEADLSMLRG